MLKSMHKIQHIPFLASEGIGEGIGKGIEAYDTDIEASEAAVGSNNWAWIAS
jgi:hypothetical protein